MDDKVNAPLVIAHRGFSSEHPDNSVEAFNAAIQAGADMIETDVRLSSDHIFVLCHDPFSPDREFLNIQTAKALREKGVIGLQDLIACLDGNTGLLLDIKLSEPTEIEELWRAVDDAGVAESTVFGVRSLALTQALRGFAPESRILGLLGNREEFGAFADAGGNYARLWEREYFELGEQTAHQWGLPVWVTTGMSAPGVWAGDIERERLQDLIDQGADGILLNDPRMMRKLLQGSSDPVNDAR